MPYVGDVFERETATASVLSSKAEELVSATFANDSAFTVGGNINDNKTETSRNETHTKLGDVNQDLVNKVASENITLKPEITNALLAEAHDLTCGSALNIVNATKASPNEITANDACNDKSQALKNAVALNTNDLATANILQHSQRAELLQNVLPKSQSGNSEIEKTLSEVLPVTNTPETQPEVAEKEVSEVIHADNTVSDFENTASSHMAVACKAEGGHQDKSNINSTQGFETVNLSVASSNGNCTVHNPSVNCSLINQAVVSNDATPTNVSTELTSCSNEVAHSVTAPEEINEFPVPDINPQKEVFTVNSQNTELAVPSTYGSKTDDLNVLIQGLETLNNQVVTNNNPHLGQYRKVLSNIISPKTTDSTIVPDNEELQTNVSFAKLSSVRNNQELQDKFSLISDVSRYINHIYAVLKGYQAEAESLKEGKSKSSHIEGMSSIISDMTYGKDSYATVSDVGNDELPSITNAIGKLPSFNENGEIVSTANETKFGLEGSSVEAVSTDVNPEKDNVVNRISVNTEGASEQDNNEVQKAPSNNTATSSDKVISKNSVSVLDNTFVETNSNCALNHIDNKATADDFTKAVQALSMDDTGNKDNEKTLSKDQILTPQVAELSPDELLRKAQEEALAQLQSNAVLNQKLKEEAATLNQKVDASNLPKDDNRSFIDEDKANLNAQLPDAVNESSVLPSDENVHILPESTTENAASAKASNSAVDSTDNETVTNNNSTPVSLKTVNVNNAVIPENLPSKLTDKDVDGINSHDMNPDTDLSKVQEFMSLTKAIALELQKESYTDSVPVIKAHTYSQSLNLAIKETLNGQLGSNHNAVDGNSAASSNENSLLNQSNLDQSVLSQSRAVPTSSEHSTPSQNAQVTAIDANVSSSEVPPEFAEEIPVDAYESDIDPVDNSIVDESYDNDEFSEGARVKGSDLKFDNIGADENSTNTDGNPKKFRESTLKLIEEDQQFENKRLGRRLESCDFYDRVYKNDLWYQDIVKAGYNEGPVYSALCYTNRLISPDDPYSWVLQISSDFQLLFISPEFHHNLRTKFSIEQEHPVEIKIEKVQGIPSGCPEDLARHFYVKEIEDTRKNMAKDKNVSLLLEHLGEDIRTLNLSLYKQEDGKAVTKK